MPPLDEAPAVIGAPVADVDTPALLLDLPAFERNLDRMARAAAAAGVRLRPHAKTHKSAEIALRQMALGAVGACCQKVGEAEALVAGGVGDVLVSNQIVGASKLARLAALARSARIGVCVDHPDGVEALSQAASAVGVTLHVLVEIDVGAGRCGVDGPEAALALAQAVAAAPGLEFDGIQAYHGRNQHARRRSARRSGTAPVVERARTAVDALAAAGLACRTVGGAGTGSFEFEAAGGVHNELQCGSYAFMDADYARNEWRDSDTGREGEAPFEHALFVLSTVMSAPTRERRVLDAGHKATSVDSGAPQLADYAGCEVTSLSDEHAVVDVAACNRPPEWGDKVRLIPGHCDPTVNLHDWYVGVRDGRVECLWPVDARGALR